MRALSATGLIWMDKKSQHKLWDEMSGHHGSKMQTDIYAVFTTDADLDLTCYIYPGLWLELEVQGHTS